MITLDNVDNALKNAYLPVIQDRLNNIDPFIASVEKTSKYIYGAEILIPTMAVEENSYSHYLFKQNLATITMPLYFSDKAIKVCQTNANAFVELVNAEVEDEVAFTSKSIQDAIYDEDKHLDSIIRKTKNHSKLVLNGFKALFENAIYCGVNKKEYNLEPTTIKIKDIDFDYLRQFIENENDEINFMICSPYVRREFDAYCSIKMKMDINKCPSGQYGIGFTDRILILSYKYLPDNVIYFVNSRDFKIHQLCDWQWIEDGSGKIVTKIESSPIYKATLVKYANLVCHNPKKQIKVVIEE